MAPLSTAAQRRDLDVSLVLTLLQILDGDTKCVYCKSKARVTLATGADPMPEPMCWAHARTMMHSTVRSLNSIWPLEAYDAT